MRSSLLLSTLFVLAFACSPLGPASAGPSAARINATVGDVSWRAARASDPVSADEDERIAVHLAWVESKLRATQHASLSPSQQQKRAALLDELHAYQARRVFPRQSEGRGRLPRFVDADGRHCAVAQLVHASAGPGLVQQVQDRFEFALIDDMDLPALDAWAAEHGLTRRELAMIQPSYRDGSGVHMPTPREEEEARRRAEEAARVPRDLTRAHLTAVLEQHAQNRRVVERCAGSRVGEWQVTTELRVRHRTLRSRARVSASDANGVRDTELERCIARSAKAALDTFIGSANHRLGRPIHAHVRHTWVVASEEEVARELRAQTRIWHRPGTRQTALAACLEGLAEPYALQVRVQSWRGEVQMTWRGEHPMRMSPPDRARFHCVQDVINYGPVERYGARGYEISLVVNPDGTLR